MSAVPPSEQRSRNPVRISQQASPRTGASSAPVNTIPGAPTLSTIQQAAESQATASLSSSSLSSSPSARGSASFRIHRPRAKSGDMASARMNSTLSPGTPRSRKSSDASDRMGTLKSAREKKSLNGSSVALAKQKAKTAQKVNDSMIYLDGPQVYTCAQCRTHLTSHDDIISKSFHGRHGRAYLFDQCVNVTRGRSEERRLMTGLHTVCDIYCKRCKGIVGWTYLRAYESSQKYKEGKYIIEKINLHLEESDYYEVSHPAGERADRWRKRSMSWGSESSMNSPRNDIIYEYDPSLSSASGISMSPRNSRPFNGSASPSVGSASNQPRVDDSDGPPAPPFL
mmetsp:Transcript_2135/g.3856  ORF Transcript_2135/g.3856 Transcript_2135/m.3856 type:complete len:340 (-) Transcript_2135:195-1214(-)